jgi:hypothetical protein
MLRQKAGIVNIDFRRAYLYVFDITAVSEALSVKRNTRLVRLRRIRFIPLETDCFWCALSLTGFTRYEV